MYKSCSGTKPPFQNLIQEYKAVIFEKFDLEFQSLYEIKAGLPLLAFQYSNSDEVIIIEDVLNGRIRFRREATEIDTSMTKSKIGR